MLDVKLIAIKREKLKQIAIELKQEFVGIDYVIDQLLQSIEIWYLMPEVLARPLIINLWGMTGVGKTDLVRSMIKKLDMLDRFLEIELKHPSTYRSSVANCLSKEKFGDNEPAIVLFDEIQRFATKDSDGKDIKDQAFTDFWELLSDGKLAKREDRDDLQQNMLRLMLDQKRKKKRVAKNPDEPPEETEFDFWEMQDYASLIGVSNEFAMNLDEDSLLDAMQNLHKTKKFYEATDYSKLLIFISGNLDSAYSMSKNTDESDIDADIFYAYTQKINIVTIKQALSDLFKPEQVARFGNQHIIYKSLSKQNFEDLISHKIAKIIKRNKELFDIDLSVDASIGKLIYENGVFPAQGVRPVFSTISDILESNLARFIFEAVLAEETKLSVTYKEKQIFAIFGKQEIAVPYIGVLDKIKQDNSADIVANISIHEAGHCIAYAINTGLVPLQLKSKVASSSAGGFVFPHKSVVTKQSILQKIQILAAGGLAEELFFGPENASTGRANDREQMTKLGVDFVKFYGFGNKQAIYNKDFLNPDATDTEVEALILEQVNIAKKLLADNFKAIKHLGNELIAKGSLEPKEILKILKKHQISCEIKDENYTICPKYKTLIK